MNKYRKFGALLISSLIVSCSIDPSMHTNSSPLEHSTDAASVAVLPLVNLSGPVYQNFSDDQTQSLLDRLTQIPDLKVVSYDSSFAVKGQNDTMASIREIAKALEVTHVLEGSVQRTDDRVRISVQLIRANDGFHLWSDTYDRKVEDLSSAQIDIVEAVSEVVRSDQTA